MRTLRKTIIQLYNHLPAVKFVVPHVRINFNRTNRFRISVTLNPVYLRLGTSDIRAFRNIFWVKEYNIQYNFTPEVIVDCGANIGLFAVWMKSRYPKAKIICIEPDPGNFEILKKNVSGFGDIVCENCGVWNKDSLLKVCDKYNNGEWGMIVEEDLAGGTIRAVSLNSILEKYALTKIDILKVDIETSEKQLFSENFDNWLNKVRTIVIELHDKIEEGCSKPFFKAINQCFERYSFSISRENIVIDTTGIRM